MKKLFFILLIFAIILVGCSGKDKPSDVRQEVWDDGIQMAIAINEAVENEESSPNGEVEIINKWEEEELSEKEKEIKSAILELSMDAITLDMLYSLGLGVEEEDKEEYYASYKVVEEIFGESNLSSKHLDEEFVQHMKSLASQADEEEELAELEELEKKKEEFISESDIVVTAEEVEFNMPNNLDKQFYLEGTVELCDYYNYGFTYEQDYFCGELTPFDGGYSDSWNVYFDRDSFDGIFGLLLEDGSVDLRMAVEIPEYMYEKGQGKMAYVKKTSGY
ncbi:hypothetical protein RZN25_18285 [Bacillaceae bacterium S4-13-56]